ncbi:MAG: tetratricopeptide repeat protein [Armatimonadetes bacterium]|nr:tetratricopeptide repeat protein [Armatimonadota bacterium]
MRDKLIVLIIIGLIMLSTNLHSQNSLEKAKELMKNNENEQAVQMLEELVKEDENNVEYYKLLATTYLKLSQNPENGMMKAMKYFKKCKKSFLRTIELDPDDIESRVFLVESYYYPPKIAGGNKKKALEQLEEIKIRDPQKGMKISIEFLMFDEDYEQAIQKCNEYINRYPGDLKIYHYLGMTFQQKEDFQKAFEAFETVIAADSTALNSLYQIGRTAIFSEENLERGVECMKLYLQNDPAEESPSLDAAHWRLGMIYEKQGEMKLAKAEYEEAIKLNPKDKDYKKALKKVLKKLK